jgi:glycerol-3-phosphate cytidylyltransferase
VRIGFTVGVFDLFHEGHKNLLDYCGARCDYLVVALVTDQLARIQKGHDRPAWSYSKRYVELRKHAGVGRIVPIDQIDEHHMRTLLAFADVWFRGVNQTNMPLVDWPAVHWVPETPGISTTLLIQEGGAA